MGSRLLNAPIVLDNGSGTIRAGFAGQDLPKCYFPSYVGRPKHIRALAGALEGDVFIGQKAQELRGLMKINYPLEHGIVTDWEDMERIWQHVYTEELKTVSEDVSFWFFLGLSFSDGVWVGGREAGRGIGAEMGRVDWEVTLWASGRLWRCCADI